MTDKIIIDGIDVSECVYALTPKKQCPNKSMPYAKETSCIVCKEKITRYNFCKNNPNCYYKQLKRKEQECESLKSENFTFEELIKTQEEFITKLETKIAFYKKYEKERSKTHKDAIHDLVLLKRYKQALDEIEKLCKDETCEPCKELEENDHCDECHNRIILEIISEAKEQ